MIDDYLRRHDGVITMGQANAAGMHREAVRRRVVAGRWRRVGPGVYFADDRPFTDQARVRAAVWGYGSRAVASGLAAAWWHGLVPDAPPVVEVTAPRGTNGRTHPGTRLRRRDLKPADIVEHRGLRVTSVDLTALEAAVRRGGGPVIMDRALQRHTQLPALWRTHLHNKGRHGSPWARILLQSADTGARSHAERLFIRLLNSTGIMGWVANHPVGLYVVDFAFEAARVVVEIDGFAFHSDTDAFHADRARQNYLVLHGWQVLRFTWRDLAERPERVLTELRHAISA